MKTSDAYLLTALLLLLAAPPISAQPTATNNGTGSSGASRTDAPSADAIMVRVKDKLWSIRELNQTALEHLYAKGSMPRGLAVHTVVHVPVDAKGVACEFFYAQGFGKPAWEVSIGYDGKVKSFERYIVNEKFGPDRK